MAPVKIRTGKHGSSPSPPSQRSAPGPPDADDLDQHLQQRLGTLDTAMAGCARGYEDARTGMAEHHGKMDQQAKQLRGQIAKLQPVVDRFLHGKEPQPLDPATAAACREYLDLNAKLGDTIQARRICYGGTRPPGEQELGAPLGANSPGGVPPQTPKE